MEKRTCCFSYFDPALEEDVGCQFGMPSESLIVFDGKLYCKFHLPVHEKGARSESSPQVFSEKRNCTEEYVDQFNEELVLRCEALIEEDGELEAWTDYSGVIFPGNAIFETEKLNGANFRHCEFHGSAIFTGTLFTASAEFDDSVFYKDANFYNANFSNALQFDNVVFHGEAQFGYAGEKFNLAVTIEEDTERDENPLSHRELEQLLEKTEEIPGGFFRNCDFHQRVSFVDRTFTSALDFKGAIFYLAPEFYNCEFHQETYFPPHRHFKDTSSEDAFHRYRVLKLAMENVRNREDEGGFFTLEQRSLRRTRPWYKNYFSFSFLYDVTSEYGINALRSLLWLTLFIFVFALVYMQLIDVHDSPVVEQAFEHSLSNVVRPFQVWRHTESDALRNSFPNSSLLFIKLLMTLQTVVCLSLLTTFFVSLRWKFKRG